MSVAVAGGGAVALNTILGGTRAYATDSVLDAGDDIGFSASNTSTINAHVLAAAVGVAIGGVAVGASLGLASRSTNRLQERRDTFGRQPRSYLQDTDVDSYGALGVSATSNQTIDANVAAASVALAVGGFAFSAAGAAAVTVNKVGVDAHAFIDGGTIKAGDVTVQAQDTSKIDAFAGAAAVAISIGFATGSSAIALGVALADNLIDNDIEAYVQDANVTVTGQIPVQSNGYIYTVPGAVHPGTGLTTFVNGVLVTIPPVYDRAFPAYAAKSGSMSITANENATLTARAIMAALAASTDLGVTVAGGGAVVTNTVSSNTSVQLEGSTLNVNGALTISAHDVTTVVSTVDAISLAIGIFSLAAGGASAQSIINSTVSADVSGSNITAGAVSIEAVATPKARSEAKGVNAGTAAVGVSLAKANVDTHVSAQTSSTTFNVDSLRIAASQTLPSVGDTANAKAQGLAGGLIGVDATVTEAINTSTVVALIGTGTLITAARSVSVAAQNDSRQRADFNSAAYGLVAAGVTKAKAQSLQHSDNGVAVANTTAQVANGVTINAGAMSISSLGSDDNQASSSPGAGGLVGIAAAVADTTSNAVTQAVLGDNAQITLTKAATKLAGESAAAFTLYQGIAGRFAMTSDHLARANTVIVTSAYGLLSGSGAEADNNINSTSNVIVGDGAKVTAYAINATSINRFDKPNIGDNVNGSTGGLVNGAGVSSDTHLTLNTKTLIKDDSQLKVIGTSISAGEFTLAARNDIHFYENVSYKGGGLGSGIGASSKFDADNVFATVQIGTNTGVDNNVELNTVGAIDLKADTNADAEMHVSVDNYGGVTVSVADATIDLSPTNSVLVGNGSHIKALSDVNVLVGMDANDNHDVYRVAVYSDTFAGSVIPIDHVVSDALLYQENLITIFAGALIETGGNVRLFADKSAFANMTSQGKAVNWASSLSGAIDKALGGNAYAQFDGLAHTDSHAIVTVDGTVRTGLNRNIDITITAIGGTAANPTVTYSGAGSDSVTLGIDQAPLVSSYFDLIADAEAKKLEYSTNTDLVAFYNREIARMISELNSSGWSRSAKYSTRRHQKVVNGVPQFALLPVHKDVLTIHVAPILAEAGYININGDVLQGNGTLDAPGNVSVKITNNTTAFLDIQGIYIPENNGGVFFNGFQNEISKNGTAETDPAIVRGLLNGVIAGQNQANADADNSDDQRGGEPVLVPGAVNLDITRTFGVAPVNTVLIKNTLIVDTDHNPWPGITVSGDIDAISASVTLDNSVGSGDITIVADIHAASLHVITAGMVVIDLPPGSVFNTGGDPYLAWKQITNPDGMGAATDADRDAELAKQPTGGIYASFISINAEYVNLNGLIQSGSSDYVLNIGADTIAEIDQIKKDIASGKIQPGKIMLKTVQYNEFKAYWDSELGKIVIQEFRTPAGSITITGKLMNTGKGQIKALGAYVNVTVNNASNYDVLIKRIDVTERGLGTIILNDKSKRTDGGYTQTWYQTQIDGTVDVRIVDFKPVVGALGADGQPVATKQMVETGAVTLNTVDGQHNGSWDYVTQYNPQAGWRYGWSVATKTLTSVTTTYGTSAWLGIDALARDPSNVVKTEYKLLEKPTLVPGSDYFYESNVSDAYTHSSATVILSQTPPVAGDKWTTSTWYGKKTYYQKFTVETRTQTTATNSIKADLPVQISFIGYEEATVKINSTGSGKVIVDNGIYNDTGLTQIVSNTVIEASNDNSVVQGVRVALDGKLGIGTDERPLQIDLVDLYPEGYKGVSGQSTAYAYVTGHSATGDIYIKERTGDMSIKSVVADKGNVTLIGHAGIVVADSGPSTYLQGFVKGDKITLTADTYVDGQGALPAGAQGGVGNSALHALQIDSGDSNDSKVNISAQGDVFVSETAGDMHLERATTLGDVWIQVQNGSLLDSDDISVKDKRTYDELKAGVWTDLQLTGTTGAQDKINATLLGFELLKRGEYDTYWRLKESFDTASGKVKLSDAERQYYEDTLSPADAVAAIATLEANRTAQLTSLGAIYAGYGSTYRPDIEAAYKQYWNYRHTQANSTTYNPGATVGLTAGQLADYADLDKMFGRLGQTQQDATLFMSADIKADYDQYWSYRSGQTDPTKFDPEYVVAITGSELTTLTASLTTQGQLSGLTASALDAYVADGIQTERDIRTAEYRKLNEQFGTLNETQKDASRTFGYRLLFAVGNKATELTGNIKVWSEDELLNAFGSGLTKSVTDTEVVIESANIVGKNIEIHTKQNIGNVQAELQLDLGDGNQHIILTDDQRVALAAAERQDIVYVGGYETSPGVVASSYIASTVVNFAALAGGTQGTITGGANWPTGMFKAGDLLYIAGNTQNTTEDNAYFTVVSVIGNVITVSVGPDQSFVTELGRTVALAKVVDDPTSTIERITRVIVNRREDVDLTVAGLLTAKAGGAVYLGSEATIKLNNVVAGEGTANGDDIRIKTSGSLINAATSGVNLDGANILLEASKGHIGEDGKAVTVTMRGDGGLIARAQDNVRITAPTSDLRIESVYSKSGNAYLTATDELILDALPGSTATKVQAQHIWLSAGGSIGTSTNALEIDVTGALSSNPTINATNRGTIIAVAGGSIFLTETHGDMNLRGIHSINGDVTLVANEGSIIDAELPDPTYNLSIPDSNIDPLHPTRALVLPKADVIGRNINLTAHLGIGTAANELDIDSSASGAGMVSAHTDLDSIYLIETAGDLILNEAGAGTANAAAFADAVAFITAVNGSILNGRTDGLANIISKKTYLFASKSIGTSSKRITTAVANLESWSYENDTWIENLGALEVGGVRAETSGVNAGGGGYIKASSPILISESSIAEQAELEFWAEDDNEASGLGDDALPDDITVAAGVTLEASVGEVRLLAGDDIFTDATSVIISPTKILIVGDYQAPGFSDPDVGVGSSIELHGALQAPEIEIFGGLDKDTILIDVAALRGNTFVHGGADEDLITVNRLPSMTTYLGLDVAAGANGLPAFGRDATGRIIRDELTIDGEGGTDAVVVNVRGNADYVMNIHDSGVADDGVDTLTIEGTSIADTFLLRKNFIAHMVPDGTGGYLPAVERINYDASSNGRVIVEGNAGADRFYLDDNSAILTIDGGADADFFQVGQIFGSSRDQKVDADGALDPSGAYAIISEEDRFATIETTLGYLSQGITVPAVLYGGTGEDMFVVYSNHADLRLEGEDGNDEFVIRAFALAEGVNVKVNGGNGDDVIQYNVNAPVNIDGGAGFDRVVVLGTELADTFVITKDGVYGAGLTIKISNAEAMDVDGLEGDDTFYVLSTADNIVTTLIGGLGSDTFNVAGDVTQTVVSDDANGDSGIITHTVSSADPRFSGLFTPGIDLTTKGSTAVAVDIDDGLQVTEDDPASVDSYMLTLPMAPVAGTIAYVTVSAAQASAQQRAKQGQTILVSLDGITFSEAVTVAFDSGNWTGGQRIYVKAISDSAEEGKTVVAISHSVINVDGNGVAQPLDNYAIPNVLVTVIDDDKPDAIITESGGSTSVFESGASDDYTVVLSKAPAAGEIVTVTLTSSSDQVDLSRTTIKFGLVADIPNGIFAWNVAQTVLVFSPSDGTPENRIVATISNTVTSNKADGVYADVDSQNVSVEVVDSDTAAVRIIETDGNTTVSQASETDSYQIVLSTQPTAPVTVHITIDGQAKVDLVASPRVQQDASGYFVVFDGTNWDQPVTVNLMFDVTGQAPPEGIRVFSQQPHDLTRIGGPLFVEGGVGPEDRSLTPSVALPDEFNPQVVRQIEVDDGTDVDQLVVFSDTAQAPLSGVLTDTHISGLGMPSNPLSVDYNDGNPPVDVARGITYTNLQVVEVLLGVANDNFTIDSTKAQTLTVVHGGGGSDTLTVHNSTGPVVLFGDTSANGLRYSSTPGTPNGTAYSFLNTGNDIIDASGAHGVVVIDGGAGTDTLTGGHGTNFIAGGADADHIFGGTTGKNWILGDSSFDVDYRKLDRHNRL